MSSPAVFQRSPLFAQLTEGQLVRLAGLAVPRRYAKDHVIFQEGDAGTALYVIVEGRVRIARSSPDGRERTIILLGPGDFFGELALLDGGARSEDAIVHEDSELLLVPREDFLAFLLEQPQVSMSLLVALSQRLRRTSQLVNDAAFFDVRARLARILLELAQAEDPENPDRVVPRLTQAELAAMVGVTRESINKWMRFYERRGTLARRGGRWVVVDPQRLLDDIR